MIRNRPYLCALAFMAAAVAVAAAAEDDPLRQLWHSRTFRRQFMGSYGFRTEVEPPVTSTERAELEKVMALMSGRGGAREAALALQRKITPASSAVLDFTLGNLFLQQDQVKTAAAWYARAVEKFPSFQRAHRNLGLVRVRAEEFKEAAASLTQAVELGARDGLTLGLLGHAHLMTDRPTSGETAYRQAILMQPDVLDWKMGLAQCLFKQRRYEEAATLCGELIRERPESSELWLLQANAFLGMQQPGAAAENYEYLDLAGKATSQSLNTLGDIYVGDGLIDLAVDTYLRAMDRETETRPGPALKKAEILVSRGACEAARRLTRRIRSEAESRLDAEERKRLLKLEARIAAARGPADAETLRILEEIVGLDPMDGEALILLGRQLGAGGEVERAAFYFERAQGISQYEAEAALRHGQCLVQAGRYQQAVPLLKRSQELRPRETVARYLEQVERVARGRR